MKGNTPVTRWSELYISYYKVMPLDTKGSGSNLKYNYYMYCIVPLCCWENLPKRSLNSSCWVKAFCEAPEKAWQENWVEDVHYRRHEEGRKSVPRIFTTESSLSRLSSYIRLEGSSKFSSSGAGDWKVHHPRWHRFESWAQSFLVLLT